MAQPRPWSEVYKPGVTPDDDEPDRKNRKPENKIKETRDATIFAIGSQLRLKHPFRFRWHGSDCPPGAYSPKLQPEPTDALFLNGEENIVHHDAYETGDTGFLRSRFLESESTR